MEHTPECEGIFESLSRLLRHSISSEACDRGLALELFFSQSGHRDETKLVGMSLVPGCVFSRGATFPDGRAQNELSKRLVELSSNIPERFCALSNVCIR